MLGAIKVQTCNLAGKALLWAVESVDGPVPVPTGQLQLPLDDQAIDDAAGEHLIQKHGIWIERGWNYPWVACVSRNPLDRQIGSTRGEAAGRALVHHIRGEHIKVPKELMQ